MAEYPEVSRCCDNCGVEALSKLDGVGSCMFCRAGVPETLWCSPKQAELIRDSTKRKLRYGAQGKVPRGTPTRGE